MCAHAAFIAIAADGFVVGPFLVCCLRCIEMTVKPAFDMD